MVIPPRNSVLGVGISVLNLPLATRTLLDAAQEPEHIGFVTVTGVHGVMESQDDAELLAIHNESFLTTPDGMPMVWLGRVAGHSEMQRVYGPDLMLEVLDQGRSINVRHYFFGGNTGVAQELKETLEERLPGLNVCGTYTPPFRPLTEEEEAELVADLKEKRPHFLWVGLSTPKQERFMHAFLKKYGAQLATDHGLTLIGVGAAFDFHTGKVSQAPSWMQKSGLEWLYRLCSEPKRLWKRYAYNNPRFMLKVLPDVVKGLVNK